MSSLRSWSNVGSQLYSLISIEIGLEQVCDYLDGTFNTCILVLSANPWERLSLSFLVTIATLFLSRGNTIITIIMFDFGDTLIPQPLFETCLTHDRFIGTKRDLVFNPNQAWCCIIIVRAGRAKKYNSRCYFDYITTCHIPTVADLLASPLAKYITLAANDCGYSGKAEELIVTYVHPLF